VDSHLTAILVIAVIAVLAPLVAEAPVGIRLPIVVLEVLFGIVLGPHGLGLIEAGRVVAFMGALGLAFLFFLAGMEIDLPVIRGRPLALAVWGWLLSVALGVGIGGALALVGFVEAPVMVGVALTTTAIGTLMPILRDAGELPTTFGRFMLAAGAVGEFGPIVLISLVLTRHHSEWQQTALMLLFVALALLAAVLALRSRTPRFIALLQRTMHSSSQLPVRLAILLMVGLVVMAEKFGLDMVLGAFAAGMIVSLASQGEAGGMLRHKLDAIGFGFLIPIFFVMSGIKFDLAALTGSTQAMLRVPIFLVLFLVVRGLPALLYRRDLPRHDLPRLALYCATALPLIVAIAEIGIATGAMRSDNAAALVSAGILSLLIYPLLALSLRRAAPVPAAALEVGPSSEIDRTGQDYSDRTV
jgi:Kef-type K+ transport system membrane component KefB